MRTGERIKQLRTKQGMTQEELGSMVGVGKAAINKYETEVVINIKRDMIDRLASALHTAPKYLMGWEEDQDLSETADLLSFPIIGSISAGYGGAAVEELTGETVDIPRSMIKGRKSNDCFVLRVKGDSMYPKFISGDKVLIQRCSSVDSGTIAAVLYNGEEATLKKVVYALGEDWLDLVPINPEYQTKRIEGSDLQQCWILGKVVLLLREV
ncbi:MAG: LexA family protein [Christensenellales bacterium]